MKKKLLILAMSCLAASATLSFAQVQPSKTAAGPAAPPSEPAVPLNRIVAIVNEEIITQTELDAQIAQMKLEFAARNAQPPAEAKLKEIALQELIDYHLQMQMAIRNNIKPTPEEVDQAIDQVAKSNKLTVDQLKEKLSQENMNFVQFRAKLTDQLTIGKLQQQLVAGQVKITDADVAQFKAKIAKSEQGKQYHLIDFYFPLPERPTPADLDHALSDARAVQKKLLQGADVDAITPVYQDLGWRDKNNLPQIFAEQLNQLTLKNASQPLRAPNGYHVLKLVEIRSAAETLTDAQIRDLALREKFAEALKAGIERARKEAYIKIIPQ